MGKRLSFFIVLFTFLSVPLFFSPQQYGHPVFGERIVLSQPDGTKIIGYIYGDEFHHRIETEEGYTIVLDEQTGWIEYAIMANKRLIPSGMAAGVVKPSFLERINFPKHLSDRQYRIAELREKSPERFYDLGFLLQKSDTRAREQALTGTRKAFVVCVEFQSEESPPTKWSTGDYSPSGFDNRLFSTDPSGISMANYYKANSYNQFYPVGYTYPNWVTLPHTASWYEEYSSWRQIIRDAMNEIRSKDPSFDFTSYANDGELDMILIWAGKKQSWGDFYWPHMGWGGVDKYDVTVKYYNAVNERNSNGTENTNIGVFCHEYGHMTGCPDLYDYSSFNKPVGYYCLMGWSNPSTNFCGYLKWKVYGWVTPFEIVSGGIYYVDALGLASVSNPRLYKINIDSPEEYLLLENRFDGSDPYYENYSDRRSGLLITHVDEDYPPAVGQPDYTFYGLEAIVPCLNPSITFLFSYENYWDKMVFSSDYGFTRLEPSFPDDQPPGSYLTLNHSEGVEHVIYRNTQGHEKSTEIYLIGISNSDSTMSFSLNVVTYTISGTVSRDSSSENIEEPVELRREGVNKLGRNSLRNSPVKYRAGVKHIRSRGKRKVAEGLSGVVMSGLPGNPTTDSSGNYNAPVMHGWSGTVTPTKTHYAFTPSSRSYEDVTYNLGNQDYTALRNIYVPFYFSGEKKLNRSLSQAEYINVLDWFANPSNENIVKYRIYQIEGDSKILLVELDADTSEYWHRNVEKDKQYTYAVCAVNDEDREGEYAYVEVS